MRRDRDYRNRSLPRLGAALALLVVGAAAQAAPDAAPDPAINTAMSVADLLRGARTVISVNQDRINDPALGDKGLSGDSVVAQAIENARKSTGLDLARIDPQSRQGQLLADMEQAIRRAMDANQALINQKGVGFKGLVPAVFGRLVSEQFRAAAAGLADIKVTAPPELVRNRKSFPDAFETAIIRDRFRAHDWPKGQLYAADAPVAGRDALRVLVPEYYGAGCLSCHGDPKGQIDITGYPKEGAKLGDLGGVISVTIFK